MTKATKAELARFLSKAIHGMYVQGIVNDEPPSPRKMGSTLAEVLLALAEVKWRESGKGKSHD